MFVNIYVVCVNQFSISVVDFRLCVIAGLRSHVGLNAIVVWFVQ